MSECTVRINEREKCLPVMIDKSDNDALGFMIHEWFSYMYVGLIGSSKALQVQL